MAPHRRPARAAALALAGMTATASCSWYYVEKPTVLDQGPGSPRCTAEYNAPVLDVVVTAVLIGMAPLIHYSSQQCGGPNQHDCDAQAGIAVVMPLVAAIPFGVSAASGFRSVRACHAIVRERAAGGFLAGPPAPR